MNAKPISFFLSGVLDGIRNKGVKHWMLEHTYNALHYRQHTATDNTNWAIEVHKYGPRDPIKWEAIGWCPVYAFAGLAVVVTAKLRGRAI